MKIGEQNGFTFHLPETGGKAGYGYNKTSSVQVRRGSCIVKQFRFVVGDKDSRTAAIFKAKTYVENNKLQSEQERTTK